MQQRLTAMRWLAEWLRRLIRSVKIHGGKNVRAMILWPCMCDRTGVKVAVEAITVAVSYDWATYTTACPQCGRPMYGVTHREDVVEHFHTHGARMIRLGDPLPLTVRDPDSETDRDAVLLAVGDSLPDPAPATGAPVLFDQDAGRTEVDAVLDTITYAVTEEGEAAITSFSEQLGTPGLLESVVEAIADVGKGRTPWSRKRES